MRCPPFYYGISPERADMESAPTFEFVVAANDETCCHVRFPGGVKPPPYSTIRKGTVGANSVRPCSFVGAPDSTGAQCAPLQPLRPYVLAPEGSDGEKQKSVKNRAALLHGLAFLLLDLRFGVPRGRAPLAGPPALSEVAGPFSVPFGVPKGTSSGSCPLKKGVTARW